MRQLWQMWPQSFAISSMKKIEKIAQSQERLQGNSLGKNQDGARKSQIRWLSDQYWLRDELFWYATEANRTAFGIDICNIAALQFTEYHAEQQGGYEWHRDVIWDSDMAFDRKISITVQLSESDEYEGGDFEFGDCENPENSRDKGTVLVFPSYVTHRVTPVTKGIRKSLVAWFEGPKWR